MDGPYTTYNAPKLSLRRFTSKLKINTITMMKRVI